VESWVAKLVTAVGSRGKAGRLLNVDRTHIGRIVAGKRRPTRMMELLTQLLVERPELRKGEKR